MKLRHLLTAIAFALPLASHAESEFSYDYLQFSTRYTTSELEGTDDDLSANIFAFGLSKELSFQIFAGISTGYINADNEFNFEGRSFESESNGYGYSLELGRYFELHNRVDAVVTAVHSRFHTEDTIKVKIAELAGYELENKENDVRLSYSIDTGLRVHLDSDKRFEFTPIVSTTFNDGGDTDTTLNFAFGFTPIKNLQLLAAYETTPEKLDNSSFKAGIRWNF